MNEGLCFNIGPATNEHEYDITFMKSQHAGDAVLEQRCIYLIIRCIYRDERVMKDQTTSFFLDIYVAFYGDHYLARRHVQHARIDFWWEDFIPFALQEC